MIGVGRRVSESRSPRHRDAHRDGSPRRIWAMLAAQLNRPFVPFAVSLALALSLAPTVNGQQASPPEPSPGPAGEAPRGTEPPGGAEPPAEAAPSPEDAPPPEASSADEKPAQEDSPADMVERLLTSDAEEEDLAWLFSNADEYAPTGLSGEPLDADVLPERGEGSRRKWDPAWRKFGLSNYLLTGGSVLVAVGATAVAPKSGGWTERNRFDEWGRRTFSAPDYDSGLWARDLSDVLVSVNIAFPMLIDSLIVTYWYRRSEEVAGQIALITAEAVTVTAALQTLTSGLASRERPYLRDCGTSIDPDLEDCTESDRLRSFFSGHTSNAFAGAAVTCSHHAYHDVFGDPVTDALACGVAFLSAGTTGLMRVVGRRHYLSDVMTGAAVGTLTGLGVPWLLHYGPLARRETTQTGAVRSTLHLVPMRNGLAVGGTF